AAEDAGAHGRPRPVRHRRLLKCLDGSAQAVLSRVAAFSESISVWSRLPVRFKAEKRRMVSPMPVSRGVEGKSGIAVLMAESSIAAAIGIGGPRKETRFLPALS